MKNFKGQTVAVMGIIKSGLPAIRALLEAGARVIAGDDTPAGRAAAAEAGAEVVDLLTADITGVQTLVLTPGIAHHLPKPHPVAARFAAAGARIVCDIELFALQQPAARIVGITGTNGKSTTTALIGHIIASTGRPCAVGGNIGTAALDLPQLGSDGVYVLELSSYQLERCPSLAVDVGVLINLSPDHLDRHGSMAGYAAAKANLFKNPRPNAVAVCGVDDEWSLGISRQLSGFKVVPVSVRQACAGVYALGGVLNDYASGALAKLSDFARLPGQHNAQNIACAYAACRALGLSADEIMAGIASFPGLAHRQELVGTLQGIRFINDSKATNADATAWALACYDPIYWIIGGKPKAGGLAGLEHFMPRVRRAFLIGEAAPAFAEWCEGKVPFELAGDLKTATTRAAALAQAEALENAVVLLSPACASQDQFKNFEDRGQQFAQLVKSLSGEKAA